MIATHIIAGIFGVITAVVGVGIYNHRQDVRWHQDQADRWEFIDEMNGWLDEDDWIPDANTKDLDCD